MTRKYMPVVVAMENRKCLVVGGGNIALRKIDSLLDYATEITVLAPEVVDKVDYWATAGKIKLEKRAYQKGEAAGYGLVIAATSDEQVNSQVYQDASEAGVLVNVVDDPKHCSFIVPAVTKRGCLTVSVATDGQAPFLSAFLRGIIDGMFPERYTKVAGWAGRFRQMVQADGPDSPEGRQRCFEEFLSADWQLLLKEKKEDEIEAEMRTWLRQ